MITRRVFIGAVAGGPLAAPLAAEAQQAAKVARIGFLETNLAARPHLPEAFRQGLRDLGYVEGRNLVIEYRDAEGTPERYPALAAELVALKVDVIVAPNTVAAVASGSWAAHVRVCEIMSRYETPGRGDRRRRMVVLPTLMSTTVTGEAVIVFRALEQAFVQAGALGHVVMVVTVSNACPAGT
jgi:hypothetical protein